MSDVRTSLPRAWGLIAGVTLVGLAAACHVDQALNNPSCSGSANNHRFDAPRPAVGKMLEYVISPNTISYHYLDTRQGDTTLYTWNTSRAYYGVACLRFATTDSVRIDSTGVFQFLISGPNSALMDRHFVGGGQTVDDSVIGSVFYGCEGDGGSYHLAADSTVTYTWANGDAHWIFNPTALHKLHSDSLFSSLTQSAYGDSVRSDLRFAWVRAACPGF